MAKDNRGGFRPRAGRPKGSKNASTLMREQIAQEIAMKEQIVQEVQALIPLGIRKKGLIKLEEIAAEEIEKEFKARVGYSAHKLLNAQMTLALGTQTLYKVVAGVDEKGKPCRKHVLVTDDEEIRAYLDDPELTNGRDYYYITTKQPDLAAINSALDRLFGKASTKIVGANNADGSEGPIKVIVANFSPDKTLESPATQPIIESVIENAIQEAVADESPQSSSPPQLSPHESDPNFDNEVAYNVEQYGNSDTTQV